MVEEWTVVDGGSGEAVAAAGTTGIARQEIEYLRRLYAKATDLLGVNTPESIAEGTEIYHRIFTPDANIRVSGEGMRPFSAVGPDEWAEVSNSALKNYVATQHLIGTQIVEIHEFKQDSAGEIVAGEALMTSYLQAWHAGTKNLMLFIGTYVDKVRYYRGAGWQIYDMNLVRVSGEDRVLGA